LGTPADAAAKPSKGASAEEGLPPADPDTTNASGGPAAEEEGEGAEGAASEDDLTPEEKADLADAMAVAAGGSAQNGVESQGDLSLPKSDVLEPLQFYDYDFPDLTLDGMLSWRIKRTETVQQALKSKALAKAVANTIETSENGGMWVQLQVEAPIVYLDEPIELGPQLLEVDWECPSTLLLQLVHIPPGGPKQTSLTAANATAFRVPLQLVCRKATSAFVVRSGFENLEPELSGPFTISNCTNTAVVIQEQSLELTAVQPGVQTARKTSEPGGSSTTSSDPYAAPPGPTGIGKEGRRVRLTQIRFEDNSGTNGGAVRVEAGRIVALQHVVFKDNKAKEGAAILLEKGALLTGLLFSRLENNSPLSPGDQGSAVSLQPGACWSFTSIASTMFFNNSGLRGGAIHAAGVPSSCNLLEQVVQLDYNQKTWIASSVFKGNTAVEDGGAIYFKQIGKDFQDGETYVHLHNVTMQGNKAGGSGGALWINTLNGLVTSNLTKIEGNTAAGAGGGIWFLSPGLTFLQFNSTTFSSNAAGVSHKQQELPVTGEAADPRGLGQSATAGRRLAQTPAAADNRKEDLVRLLQESLPGASAEVAEGLIGSGGAVAAAGSIQVVISKLRMANNTAARSGGGFYCHACLTMEMSYEKVKGKKLVEGSSEWVGNTAGASGGAFATYMLKGKSKMLDAEFRGNSAGQGSSNSSSIGGLLGSGSSRFALGPCGIGGGGAVCLQALSESIAVSNNRFLDNTARFGGAAFMETSLCARLGMACPVAFTKNTFTKNAAAASGSDIYWTDVKFASVQPGAECIIRLLNATTSNGTACSNSSSMTSSSKEFPAAMKALKGLTSGACDGNKFIGSVSASRQQYCKTIGSRPSQVEVQLVDASNRTTAALQAGSADEPGPATAGIGRHLLQQPAAASAAADEGFVVANLAPFDAIVTLKDALGSPVNETDVPVDVSLQSRGTAIRQPPAVPSPSGQYSLPGVGALSSNIGLQRVAAVATMGEQRVAVQELPLYIRRCGPGEISMDNGGPGDPVVCKYCGPSQAGNTRAQVSFNPGNSSCDACPDGAFFCDGLLLTPLDDHWQSHPFSLLMHRCPIQDSCAYPQRNDKLKAWREVNMSDAAAIEEMLQQQGGFTATNSSAYKALFSSNKTESAEFMRDLLLAGNDTQLVDDYNRVQCNEAYTGVLCGRCREGYGGSGSRGNRCSKCLPRSSAIVVWLLSRLFDLAVVGLSVWYRRMQVKIKSEETRQGPPLEHIPDAEDTIEAGYVNQPDESGIMGGPSNRSTSQTMTDAPGSLRRRDQQAKRGDSKGSKGGGDLADSSSKELGKYGWQKWQQTNSQYKRRGALVNKEIVSLLDKPMVLLRSLLSLKTAHWVDAAPILEVLFVMTQMLGLLSRVQGIWDNLISSFLSFMDFASSSETWTSFDCLYSMPDDIPTISKAYYRTLVVVLQPLITVVLILLCAALVWCVKSIIYRRQMRKAAAAVASGAPCAASGYSVTSSSTQPSMADLTSIRDEDGSAVSDATATSDTPYVIQSSLALSMQMGKPLPSLVRYVRKYIVLTISTVVLYFYSTVTVQLMALFSCKQVDYVATRNGQGVPYADYLRAVGPHWSQDYDVKCFEGAHLAWALALGIPGLLIFSVGAPLCGFLFLYRNRHRLFQPLFKAKYGQLYDHFRPKYYWWGLLRFVTLLLLTITVEAMRFWGATVQMVVFLAIMTGYTFATLCYYPWMTLLLNSLALLTLCSVLVTCYLCLTFVGEALRYSTTGRDEAWPAIARVLIIVTNLVVVAVLLMHLVAATKDIVLQYLKIAAEIVAAKATRIRGGSSVTASKRVARRRKAQNASAGDLTSAAAAEAATERSAGVPVRSASGGVGSVAAPTAATAGTAAAAAAGLAVDQSNGSTTSSTPGSHPTLDSRPSTP